MRVLGQLDCKTVMVLKCMLMEVNTGLNLNTTSSRYTFTSLRRLLMAN
jgi:hypothetical protein